ncbi:TPA: hypothetical protein BOS_2000 [Bos taurus]|nr:TPA: hypothetical protein BOS_2000 [Bos taurus]
MEEMTKCLRLGKSQAQSRQLKYDDRKTILWVLHILQLENSSTVTSEALSKAGEGGRLSCRPTTHRQVSTRSGCSRLVPAGRYPAEWSPLGRTLQP